MNALFLTEPGQISLTDVPVPEPGPDEIRLRVAACGICGSDVHGYTGASGRRIPPLVMGHEAAGTIDAVGAGVTGLAAGQRVALDSTVFCGSCEQCRSGRENLCSHRQVLGVSCGDYRRHGCFAEYAIVPARICYPIPDSLDFPVAALLEPLTIGLHAINLGCQQGMPRSAVVVGCGMIGLVTVAALAARGVPRIAAIDIDPDRLAEARRHGAAETFDGREEGAGGRAAAWATSSADVDGADLVIEAVGNTAAVSTAIDAVTRGGSPARTGTGRGRHAPRQDEPVRVTSRPTAYGVSTTLTSPGSRLCSRVNHSGPSASGATRLINLARSTLPSAANLIASG